ncbi:lamin-like protein [Prosopis cineraria]|uniref:lamin-like protein n=1 Tax=Prosopis cineraria TaxID=364024 RepID=UPI00241051AD|nr:lamin-like protein [Prosopis cineraria]
MKILRMKEMVWGMVMVTMMIRKAKAEIHYVGGSKLNWAPRVNFSEWSSHEHFYVGDWLYFGFDKNIYNVLEVNKTSYENCIETDFINNITRGGRDVFQLTEPRFYYFLSGRGHCWEGMKVAIQVVNGAQPSPSPLPQRSPASDLDFNGSIQVLVLSALVWRIFSH